MGLEMTDETRKGLSHGGEPHFLKDSHSSIPDLPLLFLHATCGQRLALNRSYALHRSSCHCLSREREDLTHPSLLPRS